MQCNATNVPCTYPELPADPRDGGHKKEGMNTRTKHIKNKELTTIKTSIYRSIYRSTIKTSINIINKI